MIRTLVVLALCAACIAHAAPRDPVATHARSITQLADGVYMIRHEDAPDAFPQGNTLVVIGTRAVLVVDSSYLPSTAREDIAQIQRWTKLPVRYLVNTHWHYDHTQGNGAYRDAFPGLVIVAHRETQKQIRGYVPQWLARYPDRGKRFRAILASGKSESGIPLTEAERAELTSGLAGIDPVWAQLRALVGRDDVTPDLAFDREVSFDLGGRAVRVLHLGRGNTLGDAVVYLPTEKLVATGDLVDHPVPYLGGGYPVEQIATLDALVQLGAETYVPGHGEVLHGSAFVLQERALLATVVDAVDRAIHRVGNGSGKLEAVRREVAGAIDRDALRAPFASDDKEARDFFDDYSFPGLVEAAFAELWGR